MDGVLAETSERFRVLSGDCSGRLVLGTGAQSRATWNGDLLGIAIYNQSLSQSEVQGHYEAWSTNGRSETDNAENLVALYLFGERSGSVVHNQLAEGPDLYIPPTFRIPYHSFRMPWKEIETDGVDWQDVGINIAGFISFGLFFVSFFLSTRCKTRAVFATIVVSVLVSLIIEILQWYLPTRTSSLIDVITNAMGSGLGVILYHSTMTLRAGLPIRFD